MKTIISVILLLVGLNLNAQVGINTDNPQSTLDINGTLSVKHAELTGSAMVTEISDGVYFSIEPTGNNQEFRLPDATDVPGRIYILRNIQNTHNALITTQGSDSMDPPSGVQFFAGNNSSSGTLNVTLSANNDANKTLIFISDGSNWTYGVLGYN